MPVKKIASIVLANNVNTRSKNIPKGSILIWVEATASASRSAGENMRIWNAQKQYPDRNPVFLEERFLSAWKKMILRGLDESNRFSMDSVFKMIGVEAVALIRYHIDRQISLSGPMRPNSDYILKRNPGKKVFIDTGQLYKALTYRIRVK